MSKGESLVVQKTSHIAQISSTQMLRPFVCLASLKLAGLFLIYLLLLPGCARRQIIAPFGTVSVHMDNLLPLHPAWADIGQLDSLTASSQAGPSIQGQSVVLEKAASPKPLQVVTPDAGGTPPPVADVVGPAQNRIEGLRSSLMVRGQRVLKREKDAALKQITVDVAAKKSSILAGKSDEEVQIRNRTRLQVRDLQLRAIALESQLRVFVGPAQAEARIKLEDVNNKILAQEQMQERSIAEMRNHDKLLVETFRNERLAEMQKQLADRKARSERRANDVISSYREDIRNGFQNIAMPRSLPRTASQPMPPDLLPGITETAAQGIISLNAASGKPAHLVAERQRLLEFIQTDVLRRAQRLARDRHLILLTSPTAGSPDITGQMTQWLREDYARKQ